MPDPPPNRKPPDPRRPPVIVPPPPGTVLGYQQPRRQKRLPRRIANHIRYHYADRLGYYIMFIVGPICIFFIFRPFTFIRLARWIVGG